MYLKSFKCRINSQRSSSEHWRSTRRTGHGLAASADVWLRAIGDSAVTRKELFSYGVHVQITIASMVLSRSDKGFVRKCSSI